MDRTQVELALRFDEARRRMMTGFRDLVALGAITATTAEDEIEATATAMRGIMACEVRHGE